MAVTECKIIGESRGVVEGGNSRAYRMRFKVTNDPDAPNDNWQPIILAQAKGIGPDPLPDINDPWIYGQTDLTALVKTIDLVQDEIGADNIWFADVEWAQPEPPSEQGDNPIDRIARYNTGTIIEQQPVTVDKDGKPLRNSAEDDFTDSIMLEYVFPTIEITKNIIGDATGFQRILDWNIQYTTPYQAVNSVTFFNGAVRTVKFIPITHGDLRFENNVSYYPATFRFAFKPNTWDVSALNQGFNFLETANDPDTVARILLDGEPSSSPRNLELDGTQTPKGTDGNFLEFRVRPELDLNILLQEAGINP